MSRDCLIESSYRKSAQPSSSILLDWSRYLEVVLGAGGVTLERELAEHHRELAIGRRYSPSAQLVVGIKVWILRRVQYKGPEGKCCDGEEL